MVAPRKIVRAVVESVYLGEKVKPVQEAVRRVFYKYGIEDERLYNRLAGIVYNIFRNYGLIDYVVGKIIGINPQKLDPITRSILRVAGYVFQLDPIADNRSQHKFYKYLTLYTSEKLGPHSHRILEYINKLLVSKWSPTTKEEEFMVKYRIHPGLYKMLENAMKRLGEDVNALLEAISKPPPHTFRVNSLKASPIAILNYLNRMGYRVEKGVYSRNAIRLYGSLGREVLKLVETGVLIPQDEASIVAVELMPLREGIVIADLCAAPGNKTSYIAELTQLKSEIHAFDVNKDRIKRMRKLLERTGTAKPVRMYHMDARKAVEVLGKNSVDVVLVDPPCSSTGAIARNPEVRWRYQPKTLARINELQRELLLTAVEIVRTGGYIMYTTCSLLPSEGEEVVKYVLEKSGELEIVKLEKPFKSSPILLGTMRSYPHIHGVTGFYYALLRKK
ncbi:MAG: RsmB/NOP family class I SAM-dependent RNA methyltransferase [Thermoprotei archaeon]